jgi:hypothetical protein
LLVASELGKNLVPTRKLDALLLASIQEQLTSLRVAELEQAPSDRLQDVWIFGGIPKELLEVGQCFARARELEECNWITTHFGEVGEPWNAGDEVWLQAWYRDPQAPCSAVTSNTTDAVHFVMEP